MPIARIEYGKIVDIRPLTLDDIPPHKRTALGWRSYLATGDGSVENVQITDDAITVTRTRSPDEMRALVNAERDRRMAQFTFGGAVYDFDQTSRARIDKAKTNAMAAIELGAQPGDLRWADPDLDFGWITKANALTPMDAQTTLAFGLAAAAWEGKLIVAARNLKDQNPVPQDYADDSHWPSG